MYRYKEIREVHLEITQRCQAACSMCDRNQNGGNDNPHLTNAELTIDDCKRIFPPTFIKQLNTMYMCGNLGDPIVAKDTLEVFRYFREHNPNMWLSMNTNAGAKDSKWWSDLATVFNKKGAVIFSIDGLEDTNHLYRQNVKWDIVERSFKSFINAGGRARWDYLIFAHNEHQVELAESLSTQWGFEKFIKKKSGRFYSTANLTGKESHQSVDRKGNFTQILEKPKTTKYINLALLKEQEIEKSYGSMKDYYDKCEIECKVSKSKSIFITAEGLLMPCCWTAGRMYKWWHEDPRVEQIWDHIEKVGGKDSLNVVNHSIETVMTNGFLDSIKDSWKLSSIKTGKLGVCSMKCGSEFDTYKHQFS